MRTIDEHIAEIMRQMAGDELAHLFQGTAPFSMSYRVACGPKIVEGTVVSVEDAEETPLALPLHDNEAEY